MSRPILILTSYRSQGSIYQPPAQWPRPPPNGLVLAPIPSHVSAPILVPAPAPFLAPVLTPAPAFVPSTASVVLFSGYFYSNATSSSESSATSEEDRGSINPHCPRHGNLAPRPSSPDEERGRQITSRCRTISSSTESRTRSRSEPRSGSTSRNTSPHVHQTQPQVGEDLLATQALRDLYRRDRVLHGKIWKCVATQLSKPGVLRAKVIVDGLECPSLYTPASDFGKEVVGALEPYIKDYVMIETGKARYKQYRDAILDLACIAYRTVGLAAIQRAQEARQRRLEESMRKL
ncbi:hypothetical protein F4776DRAFT_672652 [Hypoxylon sp. NC0597]|nr:hypothetical protein F4776DRAFT_672652 [Hypoxylon sp. NC0597]